MFIIAGHYRHQRLNLPKGTHTRPSASRLREALFNICQSKIEDARFLDLFAGSGAVGLEALSRGAKTATFVDSHAESVRCIQKNIAQLKVAPQCQILMGDVLKMLKWLDKQKQTFDIIFADPPYQTCVNETEKIFFSEAVIRFIDQSTLLAPEGRLFIEEDDRHQPRLEDLQTLRLHNTRRLGQAALQQYFTPI